MEKPIHKLVTVQVLCEHLGVCYHTVRKWRQQGILKAGLHYRRKFVGNVNSPILYDLDKVDTTMMRHSMQEEREMSRMIATST